MEVRVAAATIGMGLFAARTFAAGETILHVAGRIVRHEVLWRRRGSTFSANCIRFGPETYLDPGDGPARYVNHSCAPNAFLRKERNRLYLVAARRIGARAELTFDYSTTIGADDIWTMRCRCGRAACRGTIGHFGSLPDSVKVGYMRRRMVPGYVLSTLEE